MDTFFFSSDWYHQLQAASTQAPLRRRAALMVGARCIGSVDDEYFCHLWRSQRAAFSPLLLRTEDCGVPAWHLLGEATFALEHIATALKQIESSGVASLWRNELLDVRDCDELPVGQIERGAVRALGISTRAVHLVGCDEGESPKAQGK